MTTFAIAENAIDLFLEYRDKHGHDESASRAKALCEFLDTEPESAEVTELAKKARHLLRQIVNGCLNNEFERDVAAVRTAIDELAKATTSQPNQDELARWLYYEVNSRITFPVGMTPDNCKELAISIIAKAWKP